METLFEIAKKEFEVEDDEGKHKLVYAYFGLSIYFSQCLEETFSIMLWTNRIVKRKVTSNKEVNNIIDEIEFSKKTLGNFINEIKQAYNFTEAEINELEKILEKRNYIVHKYFKLNIYKFTSEYGQLEMINYLCKFIDDVILLDSKFQMYYRNFTTKIGLNDAKITEISEKLKLQEFERTKNLNIDNL